MQAIQKALLAYIEAEDPVGSHYANLIKVLDDFQVRENKHDLNILLHIIISIFKHHYRNPDFFPKIFGFLKNLSKEIKTFFSNYTIFNIFKGNKRILLFLIEEQILLIDKTIVSIFQSPKYNSREYPYYFQFEMRPFINQYYFAELNNGIPEEFDICRRNGKGFFTICEHIIKDNLKEFISYTNKNDIFINCNLNIPYCESNNFLNKYNSTVMEYSFFFGSTNIIEYLLKQGIKLTPSLWIYAIHGNKMNLIHFLEEKKIEPEKNEYNDFLKQSMKCHHNDIARYIKEKCSINEKCIFINSFKYYNFDFMQKDLLNGLSFYYACKYDYYSIVISLIDEKEAVLNKIVI